MWGKILLQDDHEWWVVKGYDEGDGDLFDYNIPIFTIEAEEKKNESHVLLRIKGQS
jgi:hypothetical protein